MSKPTCPTPRALWLGPGRAPLAACCARHMLRPVVFAYPDVLPDVRDLPRGGAK